MPLALERPGKGWGFCELLTACPTLTAVMIPDGVTEGLFVIVSLAPVSIFQATLKNKLYNLIKTVHAES